MDTKNWGRNIDSITNEKKMNNEFSFLLMCKLKADAVDECVN